MLNDEHAEKLGIPQQVWRQGYRKKRNPTKRELAVCSLLRCLAAFSTAGVSWFLAATSSSPIGPKVAATGWTGSESTFMLLELCFNFAAALVLVSFCLFLLQTSSHHALVQNHKAQPPGVGPIRSAIFHFLDSRTPFRGYGGRLFRYALPRFAAASVLAWTLFGLDCGTVPDPLNPTRFPVSLFVALAGSNTFAIAGLAGFDLLVLWRSQAAIQSLILAQGDRLDRDPSTNHPHRKTTSKEGT